MLREQVDAIIRGISPGTFYNTLNDVDGPGRGNSAFVERIERPKEGGILLYLLYYKYPYKGKPDTASVDRLHTLKKILFTAVKSIQNRQTKIALALLLFLPKRFMRGILLSGISYFHYLTKFMLAYDFIRPDRYSRCIREVYRTFGAMIGREKEEWMKKAIEMARDIICMLIELDTAYKFRFQDISLEIKLEEILGGKERMLAEIERLFSILIKREKDDIMRNKWIIIRRSLLQVLKRTEMAREFVKKFFKELNLKEIYPDEGDRYFDLLRKDYDFFGKTLPERIEERKQIDGENWKYFEILANSFLADYKNYK